MLRFLGRKTMKSEKSVAGSTSSNLSDWSIGSIARIITRLFQFVMGLTVIGLYAQDLVKAKSAHKYADPKWVYAVFCGAFGALTSVVFMLPLVKSWIFFGVDFLIFFFYMVLFGIFGKMYMQENPEGNKGIIRMKRAAWIDMVNMLLWFGTAVWGLCMFFRARKERGRQSVV
ncbi:uncharacterized protein BDR25DRAFT_229148 [Lindgomyces ingoldianus]|uniref:Uncharacterized protein n=1 Tax=Lindgomyces ingoldianus TaxID=673940 RepID=A0ACB6QS37_9PLEO|nr:uncharacterized protein BDR25DRAFT_229148 [Lindgomyces ingoldianus]KAF2469388.1 hypothetical protein BDR25DRAFT_229148 [Lindgomyces ingoldianus]